MSDRTRFLWLKSVFDFDAVHGAYLPSTAQAVRWRVPANAGDHFELHSTDQGKDSLEAPSGGDVIGLTQQGKLTHLVKCVSEHASQRTDRPPGWQGYPWCREVRVLAMKGVDLAPRVKRALGFRFDVRGGQTHAIGGLVPFRESGLSLGEVQEKAWKEMSLA